MKRIKIILPIGEVPVGGTVTKKTGEMRFTVKDVFSLRVFPYGPKGSDKPKGDEVKLETKGCRYMIPEDMYSGAVINVAVSYTHLTLPTN